MWLAYSILQSNKDETLVNELLENKSLAKNDELVALLSQWRDNWFSDSLLNYMFDEYEGVIKEAIKSTYHPVVIRKVREYTLSQWFDHRNIGMHIFPDSDYFFDFFAPYRNLNLPTDEKIQIAEKWFSEWSLLLWSSFVYGSSDNLYMLFSKIKNNPPENGKIQINYLDKWFARAKRDGLESVSLYLNERFWDKNIFDVLSLDPDIVL